MKCPACGARCGGRSRFCNMCGAPIPAPTVNTADPEKKELGFGKIAPIVRNILLLAVSLVLLITAFTSIVRLDFGEISRDTEGYYYDVSPVETIVIFANSLYNLNDEEMEDNRLYDRLEDVMEDLGDALTEEKFEDLSKREQRDAKTLVKLTVRLAMRHEDAVSGPSVFFAALLSVAYVALGILAFVFATVNLVGFFIGGKSRFSVASTLSVFAAMLLPVLHYAIHVLLSHSSTEFSFTEQMYKVGAGVVISLVVVGVFVAYCLVERILLVRHTISVKRCIVNAIVILLCVVMLILVSAPAVGITAETELSGKSEEREIKVNLGSSFYGNFEMNEETIEDVYDSMGSTTVAKESFVKGLLGRFGLYTASDVRRGLADHVAVSILTYTMIYGYEPEMVSVFAYTQAFATLAAILVSVVLAHCVLYFVLGEKKRWVDIICSLAAVLSFALEIAFIAIHTVSVNNTLSDCGVKFGDLSAHICAAPIILAVLAAFACVAACFDKANRMTVVAKTDASAVGEVPVDEESVDTPITDVESDS